MQPQPLQGLASLTDADLAKKRRAEIDSGTAYHEAVLQALQPDVVRAFGSGGYWELSDGTLELPLSGRLFPTTKPEELWNNYNCARRVANDYGDWSLDCGELLVVRISPETAETGARFVHTLQEGKNESLLKSYNPKYESLEEPQNYNNNIWMWSLSEYESKEMPTDFFTQRGFTLNAEPQTIYERVLTPRDVALHPIFAQQTQDVIERLSKSAFESRRNVQKRFERQTEVNTAKVNRILAALKGE